MTAEEQADDEIAHSRGGDAEEVPQLGSAQVTHGGYGQRVQTRTAEDRFELLERAVLGLHERLQAQVTQLQDKDKGKRKPRKPTLDKDGNPQCYGFLDTGKCRFGDGCRFSHNE